MTTDGQARFRLRAFVLGSAIVHLLVLAGASSGLRFGGQSHTILSMRLVTDADRARPSNARLAASHGGIPATAGGDIRAAPAAAADTGEKPLRAPLPDGDTSPSRAHRDAPTTTVRHDSAPAVTAAGPDRTGDEARARIQTKLYADFARYFDYPYLARLRGWEGEVLLAFVVQAGGGLDRVRVARSSGFAVLDRSAVDSLKKVERIPEAVAWLQGRDIEMQLPILYRLKGER